MNLQNNINIKKIFVLVFAVLLVCSVSKVSAQAVPAEKDMLLVFDASGSMLDKFGGVSRIDALKSATGDLLDILDPSVMVGLRPFANVKQPTQALACKETSLVQDFTKERTIIKAQSSLLQAVGTYTPLAYTLNIAIGDYTVGNDNVLILLTDGKDTCGGDPVKAAGDLFKSTKKVKIYVIGLGVDVSTQTQLKAIASAGGGLYYNANDSTTLASSFKAIQEAERPVDKTNTDSTLGKEVIGGNGFETATDVGYGDYHLSHNLLPDQFDYFKLPVTAGKKITFTVQNADLGVLYDKVTNTFSESSKTEDSYKFEVFT
ncbi:MAG: VWA domain-containing protein, partial [bacterium]